MGDLDITLRHIARQMPESLVHGVLGPDTECTIEGWQDTQVTALERRLDRVLAVRTPAGRRWLHVEWEWEWSRDLPYRVYEYQALLSMAQRDPRNKLGRASIESTVVLLTGRSAPWPSWGRHRVSPRGERFSGARFRIDPVYQRTVAELVDRESLLWLVFAPLARDAAPESMGPALTAARALSHDVAELAEVVAAMEVVADYAPRSDALKEWFMSINDEGMIERSRPFRAGEARGEARGEVQGLAPLVRLFERKLQRALADGERVRLLERLHTLGPERLGDAALDLDGDALGAWLADDAAR